MYIGYHKVEAIYVPICIQRQTVGKLARKMTAYYDNFDINEVTRVPSKMDLSEFSVIFFAKSKSELRTGLASGPNISFTTSGPVVLFSGPYNNGGGQRSAVKAIGNLFRKNIGVISSGRGEVVSLKAASHGLTVNKLKEQGYFVSVMSQAVIAEANVLVPNEGVTFMGDRIVTTKSIATMLNHDKPVAPNTREHEIDSQINWFRMKQRRRKLANQYVANQDRNAPPEDFDEITD